MTFHAGAAWTDARVTRLRGLWADGYSASLIAADLGGGVTRNAVISKIHRLNLKPRNVVARKPQGPRRQAAPRKPRVVVPWCEPADPLIDLPADESPTACTIMDLKEASCRWPLGHPSMAMQYCGAAKHPAGGSYCARHARIAYQPNVRK